MHQSHLVKHTDFIPPLTISIRVIVVVMELWTTHPTQARFAHVSRTAAGAHVSRWWHPCGTAGTSHMRRMCSRLNSLSIVDLGHSSNATRPQSRILIAVSPTVNRTLNQSSLAAKTWIQLRQGPSDRVALSLVNQPVSAILVLAAASSGVHAVFRLEFRAQSINIDRFNIASDGIFHLDTIPRVLERDPLNTIVVLTND